VTAEAPTADEMSRDGGSLPSRLRVSLSKRLNAVLRGAASPEASRWLRLARDALRADALDAALRGVDRAWRCCPEDAALLAPIYARFLLLEAHDDEAALRLLRRGMEFGPDPEVAALIAWALLRLGRFEDARWQIQDSLAAFCVESDGLLFQVAGEVMQHPAVAAPGWFGRGPTLELIGELRADEPSHVLELRFDGNPALTQLLRRTQSAGRRAFRFESPQRNPHAGLEVTSRGVALLGSGSRVPEDFALDGRTESRGRHLTGWARVGWSPMRTLRIRFEDETGRHAVARTVHEASGRQPFDVDWRAAGLRGARIKVMAELPDGRRQPLPDSPLLLAPALRVVRRTPLPLRRWDARATRPRSEPSCKRARLTDVIIPVYRGREETLACLESVLASVDRKTPVLVVDDASDDPILVAALAVWAANGRIELIRNTVNQGFVVSVNRALRLHPTHDAVLLNADTQVFGDWLPRLRKAAYSGPAVGTVTPLSNRGSIASYARARGGMTLSPAAAADLDTLAAATHAGTRAEIPVGVGFCLYVRRDCLRAVGDLDAAVFAKGYGEETDFCLRARARGWSHQLAADVFVYHAGGVSFGGRRAALRTRSQRLLNLRHPGYDRFIASFLEQDPLHALRRRLDERRLLAFEGRFVLLVTLALTGGVDRYVTERCAALRAQGLVPLVMKPAAAGDARRVELSTDALDAPDLRFDIPAQLPELTALLGDLRLEAIEIHHFLDLDARVIEAVRELPVPYDVFVHDYAWICPRVTLIDGSGRYCGEPAVSVCRACVRRNGSALSETITVPALRARSADWLSAARQVIAPSTDTADRLRRHFDRLQVAVQPHAQTVPAGPLAPPSPPRAEPNTLVRVALIGALGVHKGYRILLECAREARRRRLPLEFVVIGHTENDAALLKTGKVFITGRYSEGEAPHLLRRERPDVAFFPSVWPETWCYTLDDALAAGLPVAAFDLGAIAERLRQSGRHTLLPLGVQPRRINDCLMELAAGSRQGVSVPASRSEKPVLAPLRQAVTMVTTPSAEIEMPDQPDVTAKEVVPSTVVAHPGALSASVQVLPLPAGMYLFSVKASGQTGGLSPGSGGGSLALPAMHVGLGPGADSEQVEFMAGSSSHGAWLFAATDLLVARINGGGATLILTSVLSASGEALSIVVERLNGRAEAVSAVKADTGATTVTEQVKSVFGTPDSDRPLAVRIGAHIRSRGDMSFADVPWAGRVAPGLWIEAFSVRPLEKFGAGDLEYKGLTGSGHETPWLSDDKPCGTQGMAVPLVGFALRFKPNPGAAVYDCEYSGYFQSGATVGPLRNGAPCRSTVANDPLEGIQIRLVKRVAATPKPAVAAAAAPAAAVKRDEPLTAAAARSARGGQRQSSRGS
jgi:GT2 family glycosyltransferase